MIIERYILGIFQTNTYVLSIGNDCIIIDPASKSEKMFDILGKKKPLAILLTHGHFDHIKAVDGLYKKYKCPVYITKDDEVIARDKKFRMMQTPETTATISVPVINIETDKLDIGPFHFEVLFTPGHTKGSVCYRINDNLFSGDTLFRGSIGRTDLPTGSDKEIKASLRLLKDINENLNVYPGHDELTCLDDEKKYNPFM